MSAIGWWPAKRCWLGCTRAARRNKPQPVRQTFRSTMARYRDMIPGTFTMGNAVCGFFSILTTFEGQIATACWFVILAGFLDALDGKVARLADAHSQFGRELDSLADFLSFGAAPALIAHAAYLSSLGKWGWVISIVYIMAAAYRLARFNVWAEEEEKTAFQGLPVPAAAFALVSFVILCFDVWGEARYEQVMIGVMIVTSFLMVSQVVYDAVPDQLSRPGERTKLAILVLAIIALLFRPRLLLFPFIALYILFGLVREAYRLFFVGVGKVTGKSRPDGPEE
ncbi:CDP-diacylglycerol--serine O-phosphatidyltransferase [candidate division GN15 bacterium]|nr:CDP-diacylglycerol--serine O-phosphatidyltransferase [candidate division GN15 bacterium]